MSDFETVRRAVENGRPGLRFQGSEALDRIEAELERLRGDLKADHDGWAFTLTRLHRIEEALRYILDKNFIAEGLDEVRAVLEEEA